MGFIDTTQAEINSSDSTIISNLAAASTRTVMDTHLKCDNMGAIKLSHNPVFHARSKHIEIQHHFIRERILEGEIKVSYIPIEDQQADLLTKSLARVPFEFHRKNVGVTTLQSMPIDSLTI